MCASAEARRALLTSLTGGRGGNHTSSMIFLHSWTFLGMVGVGVDVVVVDVDTGVGVGVGVCFCCCS